MFKFGDKIRLKKPPHDKVVVCGVPGDAIACIDPPSKLKPDNYLIRGVLAGTDPSRHELFVVSHVSLEFELDEG